MNGDKLAEMRKMAVQNKLNEIVQQKVLLGGTVPRTRSSAVQCRASLLRSQAPETYRSRGLGGGGLAVAHCVVAGTLVGYPAGRPGLSGAGGGLVVKYASAMAPEQSSVMRAATVPLYIIISAPCMC
jgi:hypothetical protein